MSVPCGQCIGCRLERSRQWAVRCMHEAQMYDANAFITLTYSEANLPVQGSLVKWHFQTFMKRLRSRLVGTRVRYFHCGEYGDQFDRPHYHACIFGYDFPDKIFWKESNGERLYRSEFLSDVWDRGFCSIGELNFLSAAYVARYCIKKVNGTTAEDHYVRLDERTGELHIVEPEYATMSTNPGIGADWFDHFQGDIFPRDEVICRGHPAKVPRYYDVLYERKDPLDFVRVKRERVLSALSRSADSTPERLADRQKVKLVQIGNLKRGFENGV